MSLTKRLWRMLPMALVIVLVVASAVFATEAPKALRPTVVTIEAVDGEPVAGTFPVHVRENHAVDVQFGYTADYEANDEIWARGQLLEGGVVEVQGDWVPLNNALLPPTWYFGTQTDMHVSVTTPADAADKALYTVRVEVQTRSTTQELSQFGSFADAVEIDKKGPGKVDDLAVKGDVPTKEKRPTFTFTKCVDDGVGTIEDEYDVKLTNSPEIPVGPASVTPTPVVGGKLEWKSDKDLEDADNWYFHIRGEDTLGNKGEWATFGPFTVDTTGPVLALTAPKHTNNPKPEVVVKATDLVGVDVTSGVFSITPAASGEGAWYGSEYRWTPTVDLANEDEAVTYTVTVTGVKDVLGNGPTSLGASSFVVDREKPWFGPRTPLSGSYVGTDKPTISVNANDQSPGELDLDVEYMWVSGIGKIDAAGYTGGDPNSNTFQWIPTASIGEGVKTVTVRAVDKAGNESTTTWEFIVDSKPPTLALTSPTLVTVGADNYIATKTPAFRITATDEGSGLADTSSAVLKFGETGLTAVVTGAWAGNVCTYTPVSPLDETKTYEIQLSNVKDLAGHTATKSWTFKVDATAPTISITAKGDKGLGADITADGWTKDSDALEPTFTAVLGDSGSGLDEKSITVTLNGTIVPRKVGTADGWEYTSPNLTYTPKEALAEGWHVLAVSVSDKAGNGKTEAFEFGVDIVAPKLEKTNPVGWTNTLRPEVVITAIEETSGLAVDGAGKIICTFTIAGSSSGDITAKGEGTWDASGLVFTWKLKDASANLKEEEEYAVSMTDVTDKANNASVPVALTWSFRIDTKAPKITVLEPAEEYTGGKPLISAHVVDEGFSEIDQATIVMKIDGEQVGHAFDFGDGEVTYTPAANLPEGERTVTLDVKDKAGNAATQAEWKFRVDTTGPSDPTGTSVGNLGDDGVWYINTVLPTASWKASEDPTAPDGTRGSGLHEYLWQIDDDDVWPVLECDPDDWFGPWHHEWDDALFAWEEQPATPGAETQQTVLWLYYAWNPISAGVEYLFRVRAYDKVWNGSANWSEPITFVYDPDPPTAVTELKGDADPENPYPNFSWTAATDAISGVAGYVIRIKTKGSASWDAFDKFVDFPDGATGTLAWPLKVKLDPGQYTMSIAAQDVAGNIGPAEQINFSVEAPSIVPVISVLTPTEGSYNINEISTVKFQVVDCYDEEIEVAVEGATLSHIVTIVDTPTLTQFYLLLDPQPGDLKITITVGEVTETFSYTVEAERSGFGFGRLRPW